MNDPPTADEVTIGALEPGPGQRLFYLFDFGDNLGHRLRFEEPFVPDLETSYPAIVDAHGEAPPQYPGWEDEEGDWDEADGEGEEDDNKKNDDDHNDDDGYSE